MGGIDYSAFKIENVYVGSAPQPTPDLTASFKNMEIKFNTCSPGHLISFIVKNVSDKPQRFAVKLSGPSVL